MHTRSHNISIKIRYANVLAYELFEDDPVTKSWAHSKKRDTLQTQGRAHKVDKQECVHCDWCCFSRLVSIEMAAVWEEYDVCGR